MERISAAGEGGEVVEEIPVVVLGSSLCNIQQCLKEFKKEANSRKMTPPPKRKSSSTKERDSKRAKTAAEVITPEEKDEKLAPVLEKMDTLPEVKLAVENQGFEDWSEPPILEKVVTTGEEMDVEEFSGNFLFESIFCSSENFTTFNTPM